MWKLEAVEKRAERLDFVTTGLVYYKLSWHSLFLFHFLSIRFDSDFFRKFTAPHLLPLPDSSKDWNSGQFEILLTTEYRLSLEHTVCYGNVFDV